MGKSKKRGRSSHSGSDSDSGSESDHQRKHKHKDKKSKKEKKHKKHKDKDKDKGSGDDMIKQAKKFLQSHLASSQQQQQGGDAAPAQPSSTVLQLAPTLPEDKRINEDSYFERSAEFTAWLLEERRLYFNELSTEQTHALFQEFVAVWNAGRLKPQYYAGMVAAPLRRTTHQWNIKGAGPPSGGAAGGRGGTARGMAAFLEDQKQPGAAARALERLEQKKWKGEQKELLEELLPKATGREAAIEKKIARKEEARAREASPDVVRLPGGGDIYGDDDSFAAAKAREAKRAEQQKWRQTARVEAVAATAAAVQAKEDERMQQFRQLVAQGPIVIPKRQQ